MLKRSYRILASGALALMLNSVAAAATCAGQSGGPTALLVELYTSEGCDSCPPADRWLSRLRQFPVSDVVPLSFHVDYWDYLGWKDPYASAAYSRRQREAAARQRLPAVYTPQLLFAGRDMPNWRTGGALEDVTSRIRRQPARAHITLAWSAANGVADIDATARLRDGKGAGDAAAFVALYENRLISQVKAGENRGATLDHDFVVRELLAHSPSTARAKCNCAAGLLSAPNGK